MNVARLLVALSVALALAFARAQDSDEFDIVEQEESSPAEGQIPPQFANRPSVTSVLTGLIPFQNPENLSIEAGVTAFLLLFFANYVLGKRQNRQVALKWAEEADPLLQKQFAYTALSGDAKLGLMDESLTNFKYYCTGRRFCTRFIVDFDVASRQDLFARLFRIIVPRSDYVTFQVGLDPSVVDPFVLCVSKKTLFSDLSQEFPELISGAKRIELKSVPDSMCVATDCADVAKAALSPSFRKLVKDLEDFLEFFVITDLNKTEINGFPKTETHVLTVRFKLSKGSKKLEPAQAIPLVVALIDGIGSTIKLTANAKQIAQKRRWKLKQEEEAESDTTSQEELARRQTELREKKSKKYDSLSYEEQQKIDDLNQKKLARKRLGRKK